MISRVIMYRHEVAGDDSHIMIVNRKYKCCVHRSVNQTQEISFALEVWLVSWKVPMEEPLPSQSLCGTYDRCCHRLRSCLRHDENGVSPCKINSYYLFR